MTRERPPDFFQPARVETVMDFLPATVVDDEPRVLQDREVLRDRRLAERASQAVGAFASVPDVDAIILGV